MSRWYTSNSSGCFIQIDHANLFLFISYSKRKQIGWLMEERISVWLTNRAKISRKKVEFDSTSFEFAIALGYIGVDPFDSVRIFVAKIGVPFEERREFDLTTKINNEGTSATTTESQCKQRFERTLFLLMEAVTSLLSNVSVVLSSN